MTYEIHTTEDFDQWAQAIKDPQARVAIYSRITRARAGNLGDYKSLSRDLYEMRIFTGKGYRLYFTFCDNVLLLLLNGGHKGTQSKDIEKARQLIKQLEDR